MPALLSGACTCISMKGDEALLINANKRGPAQGGHFLQPKQCMFEAGFKEEKWVGRGGRRPFREYIVWAYHIYQILGYFFGGYVAMSFGCFMVISFHIGSSNLHAGNGSSRSASWRRFRKSM